VNLPPNNQMPPDMANAMLIKKAFDEKEAMKIIEKFAQADEIQDNIISLLDEERAFLRDDAKLPIPVHILAMPDFAFSGYLQGIVVANNEIVAMLTYTKEITAIFFCRYSSILFMRTRGWEKDLVIVDTMLEQFATNKI